MISAIYGQGVYGESSYGFVFAESAAGTTIGLRTRRGALPTLQTKVAPAIELRTSEPTAKVLLRSTS